MAAPLSRLLALLATLLLPALSAWAGEPPPSPATMLADAELTSVFFLDADRGWAVGDRGVIWHTIDGGRNWKQQQSPTHCRLESVHFLDGEIGWAVGGCTQPYTHLTSGVVLRTRDGGKTWSVVPNLMLPTLRHVKFFDTKHGWAIGDGSALYPSGVFRTEDGGRSWAPAPRGRTHGWMAGDFRSPTSGAVAGRLGQLGLVVPGGVNPAKTVIDDGRYLRRLILTGQSSGWLVGDGGLVMTTADDGFTWSPATELPAVAKTEFDFRAVAALGEHVWLAGSPGTIVFHSPDAGRTWEMQKTDQTLPLRSITFVDESRGWAVGALGTILVTRDGGQTWRKQKTGGNRLAMLGVFSQSQRVPLELVAQQGGDEGYLSGVEIIGRQDGEASPQNASLPERTQEAISIAGGAVAETAWRFPLPQPGLALTAESVLDEWKRAGGDDATARLEAHLVRRIRLWRPDVIVTEDVSPRGEDPLAHLTNQIVLAAVQKAAEETAYPEQLTELGLQTWKAKKVFSVVAGQKTGLVNVTPSQWAPRLGRSLEETAEMGRGLIVDDFETSPSNIGLSLLVDHLPQSTGRRDVFSGLAILPASEMRRSLADPPAANLDMLSRASQKRHNVQQLLSRIKRDDPTAGAWLSQVGELTRGLSSQSSGEIVYQMAQRYHRSGQSESAAEALTLLLERFPDHPLADAAAFWLVQYYASTEMAIRQRQGTKYVVGLAAAEAPLDDLVAPSDEQPDGQVRPATAVGGQINSVAAASTAAGGLPLPQRAGRAVAIAKAIERTRPYLAADPQFKFPLAVALRNQGNAKQADRLLAPQVSQKNHKADTDPWTICAATEEWLPHRHSPEPKKTFSCASVMEKPRLDGLLDDPLWQLTHPITLASPRGDDAAWPATLAAAYDDEFLYLAISCRKAPGLTYPTSDEPRPRDADLSASDRVEIHLDIDRDYASWYTLAVDSRGWTHESCFGDPTWDPTWFVAASGDDEYWTAEIAIPWNQLALKTPQAKDAWAIGVQRAAGHVGFQSFTQPAAVRVRPEGFGLLVFE